MNYEGKTKAELWELAAERGLTVEGSGPGGMVTKKDLVEALEEASASIELPTVELNIESAEETTEVPPGYLLVETTAEAPDVFSLASAMYPSGRRRFRRGGGPYLVTQQEYRSVIDRAEVRKFFRVV